MNRIDWQHVIACTVSIAVIVAILYLLALVAGVA